MLEIIAGQTVPIPYVAEQRDGSGTVTSGTDVKCKIYNRQQAAWWTGTEWGDETALTMSHRAAGTWYYDFACPAAASGNELELIRYNETDGCVLAQDLVTVDPLTGTHGAGSWKTGTAIGLGAGLNPVTIALKNASLNPVTGIFFVVRNTAETTKLAIGITDGDGEAEIQLDDGTYKLRFGSGLSGAGMTTGYVYANPYTLLVSGTTGVTFMCTDAGVATAGITYAQLKGSLRLMLPQIPGVNWRFVTDPLIEQWLNSAYQEVDRKLRWTRCDHTFRTVKDQVEYVIPTVVREYIAVEMTDEDDNVYELKRIGLPEYIQRRASSTAAARPQCWVHHGDKFKLYPKPDSDAYSVTIHIVVEPPNLSVNEDQPGFPAHLHQLIIDQALVYAHRQFGDLDAAVALDAVTETKLKDERKEPALDRGGSGRVARPPV